MDKFEAWREYGRQDKERREKIKNYFEKELKIKGNDKPGPALIAKTIVEYYIENKNWDFNS